MSKLDVLEKELQRIDGSLQGRVIVFRAAEAAVREVLDQLHLRSDDDARIGGAAIVLLNVASEIIAHMCVSSDWSMWKAAKKLDQLRDEIHAMLQARQQLTSGPGGRNTT